MIKVYLIYIYNLLSIFTDDIIAVIKCIISMFVTKTNFDF